uniref:Oxidoreductase domain protein n=2 Tax=Candidatus Bipolaricaulota TaxID=67810 RepID=H5SG73_9BACT|nr:oxidoreductase domain protein [uncultured Acetothermia bacterium]BAL60198.1 oxidoreductase domain protein [Candidatus Acetothermum autotrophicum]
MAIRIGVIGYGYWGPNLVRNFTKIDDCQLVAVADINPKRLHIVQRQYPFLEVTESPEELIERTDIDAVAIITPVATHYLLAKSALDHGKHVLVEKPLVEKTSQAQELIDLADRYNKILMVDHTFIYSGAVRKIKELIAQGEIGNIYYFDSVRVNLGLFQHDVNVLWDLCPHDFSIMSYLIDRNPISVSAIGASPINYGSRPIESIAYVTVQLEGGILAHFHVNWLSPVKIRRTLIGGSKKMIVYDHLDPDNQVKIYDKGIAVVTTEERYKALIQYRTGDMYAPKLDQTEPLELVCKHFVECIKTGAVPLTDGEAGLRVVRLLEAAQQSLERSGEVIRL